MSDKIYMCYLTDEQFNSEVPKLITNYMGYPDGIYLMKDCLFGEPKKQDDGRWLCDCRLRSWDFTEIWVEGELIKPAVGITANNTNRYLTEQEVAIWGHYIGKENIFELV